MKKHVRFLFLFVLAPFFGFAQYYSLGQDPGSIKWRQMNSENFRLIYPSQFESKAQQFINLLEYSRGFTPNSLKVKIPKMPVVLHAEDVTANAFSIWAPRRLELYTAPPQSSYAQPWMEQLAIHELRHSAQLAKMNTGITKVMGYVFGEQMAAAVLGAYLPLWYIEGDAVAIETGLSNSGRGRVPDFSMELRAQLAENGHYSYDKAVNGSYRNYIPDHYALGYQLVSSAREISKDPGVWEKTERFVARNPFLPWAFNRGLKKSLGMTKESLYFQTMDNMQSRWGALNETGSTAKIVSPYNKDFTRYKYPHYINDSMWVAERTSIDDISRFVVVERNGKERVLVTPGLFSSDNISMTSSDHTSVMGQNKPGTITADNLSIHTDRLYWTEKHIDARWQNRSYSVIKYADLSTGEWHTLTHKSRYFAPSVSPDGMLLAVSQVSEGNDYSIVLLDSYTGEVKRTLIGSNEDFYITPKWSPDGKSIFCIALNGEGSRIIKIDLATGVKHELSKPSYYEKSNPRPVGDYVLYNGTYGGIDNVYALNNTTGKTYQVTHARFGAIDAEVSPNGQKLVYSDYNSNGYRIAEMEFHPSDWTETEIKNDRPEGLYSAMLSQQEGGLVTTPNIPNKAYTSEPYHKLAHAINLHSWAPFYINSNDLTLGQGLSLSSQDVLSTTFVTANYQLQDQNGFGHFSSSISYQALYPVFDLSYDKGRDYSYYRTSDKQYHRYNFDDDKVSLSMGLPLKFNSGPTYFGFEPQIKTSVERMTPDAGLPKGLISGTFHSMDYQFYSYVYRKYGQRDLAPRLGVTTFFGYRNTPFGGLSAGDIFAFEGDIYLPGILRHDGFKIYIAYQERKAGLMVFGNMINYPRGNPTPVTNNESTLSLNYKLPLLYPDLSIGPIAYIKRIKANFFYDTTLKNVIAGRGVELTADVHLFRFMFPFELGIQVVQPNGGSIVTKALVSINLSGI
jgi:hypothetical protein